MGGELHPDVRCAQATEEKSERRVGEPVPNEDLAEGAGVGAVDVLLGVRQLQVHVAVHGDEDSCNRST